MHEHHTRGVHPHGFSELLRSTVRAFHRAEHSVVHEPVQRTKLRFDPIMQGNDRGFITLIERLSEDLVALCSFFIGHDLQLHPITSREDERGTRLSQHGG